MDTSIDAATFEQLVREHHAAVYRTARCVLRDDALALDAAQQTFLRVLEGKLDPGSGDPARVLRCVAAREALMILRSSKSRARREAETAMQRHERTEDPHPEDREARRALRALVSELPDDLRVALALRFHDGLTYAEIADASGVSEPSAHERVQRAIEKLRASMSRLGFGALALPEMLAREEPLAVPRAVERRLLALPKGAAGAGVAASTWIAAAVIAAAGATWLALRSSDPARSSEAALAAAPEAASSELAAAEGTAAPTERASLVAVDATRAPAPEGGAPAAAAHDEEARWSGAIEGRVVDELGLGIEGVEVRASSVERDGKFAVFEARAATDRSGAFRLEVPVALESGQDYALLARTSTLAQDAGRVRVRPGRTTSDVRVMMGGEVRERPGAWRLWLTVRDENGRPIPGAAARVHWISRSQQGASWNPSQALALTESDGTVTLHGEGLGPKLLAVEARSRGFAPLEERIEIDVAGDTRRDVVLRAGSVIAGTLVDDAGRPIDAARASAVALNLYAVADAGGDWQSADWTGSGRFEITGLAHRPYTVRAWSPRWSTIERRDVWPGSGELSLALKLRHDPRDVGDHMAEIHVEVFDAATAAPVALDLLDVRAVEVEDASPALDDGDFAPIWLLPYVAQVADAGAEDDEATRPPPHLYVADGLAPGRYLVCAHIGGYAPAFLGPIELAEREIASGLSIRLARGATLEGTVVDGAGRGIEGATVALAGRGELSRRYVAELDREIRSTAGRGNQPYATVRTDAAGRFRLENVPCSAALEVVALHPEREPASVAAPARGEGSHASGVVVRMPRARER